MTMAHHNDPRKASNKNLLPDHVELSLDNYVQWSISDGNIFIPSKKTCKSLTPGIYTISRDSYGNMLFEKNNLYVDDLLIFPETPVHEVVDEIKLFWTKEEEYKNFGLLYKRGILLWGPPGSGKSAILQLVSQDIIERGGIVIKFNVPEYYVMAMPLLREIQPDLPVVVLMEDIDSTIEMFNESSILNILDGPDQSRKVVFLATTNYPEKLQERVVSRPSRFDKRIQIPFPSEQTREIYLNHLIKKSSKKVTLDIDRWIKDTEDMSLSHLKELFVSVNILESSYEEALKTLNKMIDEKPDSHRTNGKNMGFLSSR